MMHTTQALYLSLQQSLIAIDKMIGAKQVELEEVVSRSDHPEKLSVYEITGADGTPILAPLHIARSRVVSAMANLKASETKGKGRSW